MSLESWMGCPDGSGTKTKSYELVSQIACVSRQCLNFLVLNVHIPAYLGSRGKPLFRNFFFGVSADHRSVQIRILICIIQIRRAEELQLNMKMTS